MYLLGLPYGAGPSGGGNLAFVRWYTNVDCTQPLAIPAEAPGTLATQGDFRFENTLSDSGSAHAKIELTGAGSVHYATSAIYPPTATINTVPPVRAAFPVALTSTSFTSLLGNGVPPMLAWQQVGGPLSGLGFTGQSLTGPTSSFTPPLAGSYQIQLTATDALGQNTSVTSTIGAVATDSNNVVITGNAALDRVLGPLTLSGTSPWPYYDIGERELADTIATAALANPPALGTPLSGTSTLCVSCGVGGFVGLVGSGTHYTAEVTANTFLIVEWNSSDGPGTGRFVPSVLSVQDDTHLTLQYFGLPGLIASSSPLSGLSVARVPPYTATFDAAWWGMNGGAGSNSWNYYGVTVALYRLYYRTGLTKYLISAEQFADYWWQWAIDHGASGNSLTPRSTDLQGQFLRAMDGHPERLPGLFALVSYFETQADYSVGQDCGGVPRCDQREAGYTRQAAAYGAIADAANHATYCGWLQNSVINSNPNNRGENGGTPAWIANQLAAGNWYENDFLWSNGYLDPGSGMSPWRIGIAIMSHQLAYDLLNDTSSAGCNNPALAVSLLPAITAAVDWVWNAGRSTVNRGIYYDVNYAASPLLTTDPPGKVSVSNGSTMVTGAGTTFTTDFTAGTSWIGFFGPQTGYLVTAIADDTHLTMATPYGSQAESGNLSGAGFAAAPSSFTNCGGGTANYCNTGYTSGSLAPPNGDRNLTRFPPGLTGWAYLRTGNPKYLSWGDEWFSAAFGGPADGPNGVLPCGGPACDGLQTDWATDVFTGDTAFTNLGKDFGEGSGAPGAQTYLAARLGGVQPLQSVQVSVTVPATYPNATQMSVFVIQPSGVSTMSVCAASPCPVQVDPRQGNNVLLVQYLSASGDVLGVSSPTVLTTP